MYPVGLKLPHSHGTEGPISTQLKEWQGAAFTIQTGALSSQGGKNHSDSALCTPVEFECILSIKMCARLALQSQFVFECVKRD